ncbi:MAG: hypothetical protein QMC96_12720 [Methanomicrobiales archaeon]|nr:hypothetical protein [Methanomicrobiales archaeon]
MKTTTIVFLFCVILAMGSGCTDSRGIPDNTPENTSPAAILFYEQGNRSIPLNISAIEVQDPKNITANVTSVIEILLDDQRTGILLENGWNITSIRRATDEHDPTLTTVDVEFRNEGLSFFIVVDEVQWKTLEGYCGAPGWISGPVSGPLPEDYHQAMEKSSRTVWVFDHYNNRVAMVYNQTTIFYLYPSYSIIDMEGAFD